MLAFIRMSFSSSHLQVALVPFANWSQVKIIPDSILVVSLDLVHEVPFAS